MTERRGIFSVWAVAAFAVLVLNDHVLKVACPSVVTGKLSDFAGLFLFPVVCGAFAGSRARVVAHGAALLGGALFAVCKLSPEAAAWMSAHVARTTCDPTDLVALPMLALGARHAAATDLADVARWRDRLAAAIAAIGCMATSAEHHPMPPRAPEPMIAAPRTCARLAVAGIEPRGNEVLVHARLVNDEPNGTKCAVTLVASLDGSPSDRVSTSTRGRSAALVVDPMHSLDVTITLAVPYPVACAPAPNGKVEAFEAPEGFPEDKRPAESARIDRCTTAVAAP